jgi:uncharacterized protein HemY
VSRDPLRKLIGIREHCGDKKEAASAVRQAPPQSMDEKLKTQASQVRFDDVPLVDNHEPYLVP